MDRLLTTVHSTSTQNYHPYTVDIFPAYLIHTFQRRRAPFSEAVYRLLVSRVKASAAFGNLGMGIVKPKTNRMCCVQQCTNRSVPGKTSVHTFPRDKKARKVWITKLRVGKAANNTMVVCSSHFTTADFFWSHIYVFSSFFHY